MNTLKSAAFMALLVVSIVDPAPNGGEAAPPTTGFRLPFVGSYSINTAPGCESHAGGDEAIDYGLPEGGQIFAAEDGTVAQIGSDEFSLSGFFVRVFHEKQGLWTHHAHLNADPATQWAVGNPLKKGQLIALAGHTGQGVSGAHLHFRVESTMGQKPGVYIREMPKTIWNSGDPNNIPCTGMPYGTAKGPQVAGRVTATIWQETEWPRSNWHKPTDRPTGPWLKVLRDPTEQRDTEAAREYAYTDEYGYFHLFDLSSGNYVISAEKYHFRGNNMENPLIQPTSPLSTCAEYPSAADLTCGEAVAPVFVSDSSATTMNDVKVRLGDTAASGNDNRLDIVDFSRFNSSFDKREGDAGYLRDTDFDESDWTNLLDWSIFTYSYGMYSSEPHSWTPLVLNGAPVQ